MLLNIILTIIVIVLGATTAVMASKANKANSETEKANEELSKARSTFEHAEADLNATINNQSTMLASKNSEISTLQSAKDEAIQKYNDIIAQHNAVTDLEQQQRSLKTELSNLTSQISAAKDELKELDKLRTQKETKLEIGTTKLQVLDEKIAKATTKLAQLSSLYDSIGKADIDSLQVQREATLAEIKALKTDIQLCNEVHNHCDLNRDRTETALIVALDDFGHLLWQTGVSHYIDSSTWSRSFTTYGTLRPIYSEKELKLLEAMIAQEGVARIIVATMKEQDANYNFADNQLAIGGNDDHILINCGETPVYITAYDQPKMDDAIGYSKSKECKKRLETQEANLKSIEEQIAEQAKSETQLFLSDALTTSVHNG